MYPYINSALFGQSMSDSNQNVAKKQFDLFLSIIPQRLTILVSEINRDISEFTLSYTRESFINVALWIKKRGSIFERTLEETREIIKREKLVGIDAELVMNHRKGLTKETQYICFDCGIYFGESLRAAVPHLEWQLDKSKTADRHKPVLNINKKYRPKGCISLDPIRVMTTIGYQLIDRFEPESILLTYDYWYDNFLKDVKPKPFDINGLTDV